MKKAILGLAFLATIFFTATEAFEPIDVQAGESRHDDGEWCPSSGSSCVVITVPKKEEDAQP
ncbi:hypothetical protein NO995_07195 [Aestuariibaculum sp. M13]|uniref:hypothetical protein n=1 Tax=Aestuariibaculum sp. M13 TaxID=2967132 RepID=UPI002159C93B|nr:hypothetical protein [Aestuariibaculum sp. M13]MCR8667459.1 hypothetical protein [Aestuariibaculum sp. M13]